MRKGIVVLKDKKILFIINPVSGRVALRQKLWQVLEMLSKAGFLVTVRFTEKSGDAKEFAKQCSKDIQTVVCAGGDGTLNEVISGLMENPYRHRLGYLPVGTTNDLASSLGLSKGIINATKDIIAGNTKIIDIGSFNGRYFSYVASFGAFTEASYNATQEAKNILGHLAYLLEGIMSIGNIRPYHATFRFDEKQITDDFIFAAVSNTTSLGGILKLKERLVTLNDGKLELLLVRAPKTLQELQKTIADLLNQHFTDNEVCLYHTSKVEIISDGEFDWTLDGEHQIGSKNVNVLNVPEAIELIVPKQKTKQDM